MQWVIWMLGVAHAGVPATGDTGSATGDTGAALDVDADADGFTIAEGDCDDDDDEISPEAAEICEDRVDNDCDGLYDEGCDYRIRMGTLRGAGGCSDNTGNALILLFPLFWLRRRSASTRRGGS